jgi:hypothetical protein
MPDRFLTFVSTQNRGFLIGLSLLSLILSGCQTYPQRGQIIERWRGDLGLAAVNQGYNPPHLRMGSVALDAWYSPLVPLGPNDLGLHHYADEPWTSRWQHEVSRGTLYTQQAGFIDLAHLRNTIDLTAFAYRHIYASIRAGESQVKLISAEPDVYRLTLHLPITWQATYTHIDNSEQAVAIHAQQHEAAIAIAQRTSWLMSTWHEVLTHFGYKSLGIVTEKPSAFSFDDAAAHRIGIEIAGRAIRAAGGLDGFNQHVTREMPKRLIELGAVEADEVVTHVAAVEDRFWSGDWPTRRVVDLSFAGQPHAALLSNEKAEPFVWYFDDDEQVAGHAISDLFDVQIDMHTLEAAAIRRALSGSSNTIDPARDFPVLYRLLRDELDPPTETGPELAQR